ncbi:MAG: protoporphyrinogen oxidase HemJ [Pseudomonadota bacterium]
MTDVLSLAYPWVKSFHIMAVIAWMAGLFYLPRLYVHHTERVGPGNETDGLFQMMEAKLYAVIMRPAMIATWIFGLLLVATPGIVDWAAWWPWLKALCVIAMTGFHGWLGRQRKTFLNGDFTMSGRTYRIMNEVPTILMFVIVISVVVRPF